MQFGKSAADRRYVWDVLRFFRWSNIRRSSIENQPNYFQIVWHLNAKLAFREAVKNKFNFIVKLTGLTTSLTFTLLLIAFLLQEFSYDLHEPDHSRIYRIGAQVTLDGVATNYAVSPFALADELSYEVPEVEAACWISYHHKPLLKVGDAVFEDEVAWIVNSDFNKVFTLKFLTGDSAMLFRPNKIFLTESTAQKFFGTAECIGQEVRLSWATLEVAGVIKDQPFATHARFDVLISAETFNIGSEWNDVNAYTYIKLKEGVDIKDVTNKVTVLLDEHQEEIAKGYASREELVVKPIFERLTSIHLSSPLEEDIALKRNPRNLYILISITVLFFFSGLINYFNVSLAELTTYIKKIGILQVFGGASANHHKVNTTNLVLTISLALPLVFLTIYFALPLLHTSKTLSIDPSIFNTTNFYAAATALLSAFVIFSKVNAYFISRTQNVIAALKGKFVIWKNDFRLREILVSIQLSFSIVIMALMIVILDQFEFIETKDKGFDISETIVIKLPHGQHAEGVEFQEQLSNLPGIDAVDGSSFHTSNIEKREFFQVETNTGTKKALVDYMNCGYQFINMMNIRRVKGRNFSAEFSTDPKQAYIVNEAAARAFGWQDPIGKIIEGPIGTDRVGGKVIGVVKDFNLASFHKVIEPLIIFLGNEDWGTRHIYVKLNPIHSAQIVDQIGEHYKKAFASSSMQWQFLESQYESLYRDDLEVSNILKIGLFISILISGLGIVSLSALLGKLRSHEMGVRKIIGATQLQIIIKHLKPFLKFFGLALLIACPAIYYFSQYWLSNFAYHISLDVWYFIVPACIAILIVLVTSAFHAVKLSYVNPVDVLRNE
jgi:putative ABC transport system permease protein